MVERQREQTRCIVSRCNMDPYLCLSPKRTINWALAGYCHATNASVMLNSLFLALLFLSSSSSRDGGMAWVERKRIDVARTAE